MSTLDTIKDNWQVKARGNRNLDLSEDSPNEGVDDDDESERKVTLDDLLSLMRSADGAIDDLEIDLEQLGTELRSKVDAICEVIDYCEARAAAIRPRAALLTKRAQSFEKRSKQLREYVANCMHADAVLRGDEITEKQKLPGENFELSLQYSESVELIREPDPALYLKLKGKFVQRHYNWDKKALKKGLKENNEEIAPYATLKKSPYIKINPRS